MNKSYFARYGLLLFITVFMLSAFNVYAGRGAFIVIKNASNYSVVVNSVDLNCISVNGLDKQTIDPAAAISVYAEADNSGFCLFQRSYGRLLLSTIDSNKTAKEAGVIDYSISDISSNASVSKAEQQVGLRAYSKNLLSRTSDQDLIIVRITPNAADSLMYANWMGTLKDKIQDISLNQLVIPGTHDSFTYDLSSTSLCDSDPNATTAALIPNIGASFAKSQYLNFHDQLINGIRYFDVRLCYQNNQVYSEHSLISNKTILSELQLLPGFIRDNPYEIIILDFNHMYGFTDDAFNGFLAELNNLLKPDTENKANNGNSNEQIENPTKLNPGSKLIDFWNAKAHVIIIVPKQFDNFIITNNYDNFILWPSGSIISPWPNTTDVRELLSKNQISSDGRSLGNSLFVNQLQLTPDQNYILNNSSTGLEYMAYIIFPNVSSWLWSPSVLNSAKLNIFIEDYSAGYDQTIYSIIANQH